MTNNAENSLFLSQLKTLRKDGRQYDTAHACLFLITSQQSLLSGILDRIYKWNLEYVYLHTWVATTVKYDTYIYVLGSERVNWRISENHEFVVTPDVETTRIVDDVMLWVS